MVMISKRAKRIALGTTGLALCGCVAFIGMVFYLFGRETRTTSPNSEQVTYSREFLYINPELEIQPLAYYVKEGMDYQVRFKFIARTDDPSLVFDAAHVDPSAFEASYPFPPGEEGHNEAWWDIASQTLSGGGFWVPASAERFWRLHIGYVKNDDGTLTVYTWRHESGGR